MAGGTAEANRILLGMRDSAERRELATWLAAEGYHVSHCSDQPSLAQRIDATVAAVLLADEPATAPLDEVSAALERLPAGSAIPFILLSRDAEPYAALRARLPAAINDFVVLEEPVWPATLLSCLATCLRLHQQQRAHHAEVIERADQQARFERLIVNLPIGVSFIDPHGNTLLSNPKYDEYVPNRKIPSAAPERARRWVGLDSQGQVIPPSQYVGARALRGEQVNGQDYRYYPEEGGERWLRLSGVPLYDHAEQLMGAAVVIIDVDAERRNEVMLRQFNHALEHEVDLRTQALQEALDRLTVEIQERNHAEELLRHSQKMEAVGQLTGGIAHDFNNMLTGIIGALDLIRMRLDAGRHDDLPRYLDAAHGSAQRAAALTQRLLAFSRRQSLQTRPTEVNALIRAMADLLQRSLSETTGFELELDEAAGLALADPNQLENALLNLTLNARDAMPGGGTLRIETSRLRIDAEQAAQHAVPADEYVRLRVIDTGAGIAPGLLDKVFEPFFTTKPLGQGTGLGLSMVYGFVRQSGGFVSVDSQLGQGTVIALHLPAAAADVREVPASREPRKASAGDGQSILIVEDDDAVRLLLQTALEDLGYQVHLAADSQRALSLAARLDSLDLLISDVGLPGLNGRQLAEMLQQERPGLPVVLITGYTEQASSRAEFLGPGMRLMTKPFTLELLAETVAGALASPALA
ncbi:hybrid sensor histidine kinase/response regulator [Stutzerimonas balearica]|uniref:hybrid sensor histidine kinase/response regulator n=1 Tax=Stutzerimonas balearica TaxID=74829 RepID=UPI00190D4A1E|nr:ATP-binding protein [Stutzerimonas balearica]MBK3749231.1 response regulator [Stutzerimonas balearica]MBK3827428.1 response regulator [Stutzerimonas balearica]MBK3857118.1 response regulator [Stutzerimonas balearica]